MTDQILISLGVNEPIRARLDALQQEFSSACNFVVPLVKQHHCWNRVALHHLAYYPLRNQFPSLGSQMACNVIYSVCRVYRLLLAHANSPYLGYKFQEGDLPLIQFLEASPVFFDRHTLSLQDNNLSLFTLQGRLRFGVTLSQDDERKIRTSKLKEIILYKDVKSNDFFLKMSLASKDESNHLASELWPDYFVITDSPLKYKVANTETAMRDLYKEVSNG